jgi:hypothetical protein
LPRAGCNISYLGVIRGVQNFTPVLKVHTPWGATWGTAEECMNYQHWCKIMYTPDYTKITNLFLNQKEKRKSQKKKQQPSALRKMLFCFRFYIYYTYYCL